MSKNFFKRQAQPKPQPMRAPFYAAVVVDGQNAQLIPIAGEISLADLLNALTQLRDSVIRQASEQAKRDRVAAEDTLAPQETH